jgi:hypothetical protein
MTRFFRDKFDILGRCVWMVNMENYTTRYGGGLTRTMIGRFVVTFILAETSSML